MSARADMDRDLGRGRSRTVVSVVALALALGMPEQGTAQSAMSSVAGDLGALFEVGGLVLDTNGDEVPDFVDAALIMGDAPTAAEIRAAAEIAARLGFETMALDLPLERRPAEAGVLIAVGRSGLAASGLISPGIDPASLDAGEGVVAVRETEGRRWVLVVGGDDEGLISAARMFAGVLPHTRTLSTVPLDRVGQDVRAALQRAGLTVHELRLWQARSRAGSEGVRRLVVDVRVPGTEVDTAASVLRSVAAGEDVPRDAASTEPVRADEPAEPEEAFAYTGLGSVEVRLALGPTVRITSRAAPDMAGAVAPRPGRGAKRSLDLSNIYTVDGLLGDSDDNEIPDRIDALLAPSVTGVDALPDLAARLGLESTGLVVPLVEPAADLGSPASTPTLVLAGTANPLAHSLADSGRIDLAALQLGEGLIQLVPAAFGDKPALVVTGGDDRGANRALAHLALTFPHLEARGDDRPTVDHVEHALWSTLSGRSPAGQAAIGLYKLDRILTDLSDRDLATAEILISVEKADPGLAGLVRERAATLGADQLGIVVDNRDVGSAAPIFSESFTLASEVDRFHALVNEVVIPAVSPGEAVTVLARLSEPPEVRRRLEGAVRATLLKHGADPAASVVRVRSAFKQGYSWLYEGVRPRLMGEDIGEILIRFRRNDPLEEWPQQAIHTPLRWLHEIFPIDEILARDLELDLDQVRFEEALQGPVYQVEVTSTDGSLILEESFDPRWVVRPYVDRFRDYERVRVSTGWIEAHAGGRTLIDERIVTDPEAFWDHYQSNTLPAIYDYVMARHEGLPRGGGADAPFFGELRVEVSLSEPDYRLGIDNEIHATMDALHEEVYFGTVEFFDLIGRNSRGQGLTYPGRIIPVMTPKSDGTAGAVHISFSGFATSRPAVVVRYRERSGDAGEVRLDIPRIAMERPSARRAHVLQDVPGLSRLTLRVRTDTDADMRDSLLAYATPLRVDERMLSAEQVVAVLRHIEAMRARGMYPSALAFHGLGSLEVHAEWTHEEDPRARRTVRLAANGEPEPLPNWRDMLPEDWNYQGERLVQWNTPMPPGEGHRIVAQMGVAFEEAHVYQAGESYLGRKIWAMDLMPPVYASHWSRAKATTYKPTVIYSARQHANEVSSTSHVLRHAELLLTDPEQRAKLDRVNVIIHPFANPDGAQLAYDLYRLTPDYILHAGYLGSLGVDITSGSGDDHPIYPESNVRGRLWQAWLPDIFLNPHGYPSHQVVQLFSGYTGLVRRGRVTERNWGFNKGWFIPGFGYIDSPEFPRHRDAAFQIRDYITRGINASSDVFALNQRAYARYRRYGANFDTEVFRLPMTDSVLIEMPLKGSTGRGGGYNPRVTVWSGTTEAPDETAYGPWMKLVAEAGLAWDQAILDYLYEGDHRVERSGSTFFGGVTLRMNRARPPEARGEDTPPDG